MVLLLTMSNSIRGHGPVAFEPACANFTWNSVVTGDWRMRSRIRSMYIDHVEILELGNCT